MHDGDDLGEFNNILFMLCILYRALLLSCALNLRRGKWERGTMLPAILHVDTSVRLLKVETLFMWLLFLKLFFAQNDSAVCKFYTAVSRTLPLKLLQIPTQS